MLKKFKIIDFPSGILMRSDVFYENEPISVQHANCQRQTYNLYLRIHCLLLNEREHQHLSASKKTI